MAKESTQNFLDIKEIRDNVVVLKNGDLRSVLMISAINFNLKTDDEQQALVEGFKNFLNALTFPIQILVQSRPLDPQPYLNKLGSLQNTQSNELLRAHTIEYIEFVKNMIKTARIMSKSFYVVVELESAGLAQQKKTLIPRGLNEKIKELTERTQLVSSSLAGIGLSNVQLETQELLELFYTSYNGEISYRQKLFNVSVVEAPVIRAASELGRKNG
jgi:type IV secretory pathway VirB4 component